MPRDPSDPIAFAAGEAMAQGARVAIVAWEVQGTLHYRTVPDSLAVLIGLHSMLADAINALTPEADDDDAGE
jgi:hypothetical protein